MLSLSVPNNVKEVLTQVTPNFEEFFKDEFIDEGNRIKRKNRTYQLENVFTTKGNININISNLNLATPTFDIKQFRINMEMLNVYIEANLGQLIIEGDLKQSTINTLIPMNKSGKIMFALDDVVLKVNVGIYMVEDSFMAICYDLDIKPAKILSKVSCTEGKEVDVFESSDSSTEESLVQHIWPQLIYVFCADILYSLCNAKICEQSVTELLLDEPEDMRRVSDERLSSLNNMVDALISTMNEFFTVTNQTSLETPPFIISLPKEDSRCGIFKSVKGELRDLSTFVRARDMCAYQEQDIQYIFGILKLKDFKFQYLSCNAKYGAESSNNGTIKVGAYRSEIFVKLSLKKNGDAVDMAVEKVQVLKLMDVDFDMFDLDCLSSQHNNLNSWVQGSLRGLVFPVLERKIEEGLSHAIRNRQH